MKFPNSPPPKKKTKKKLNLSEVVDNLWQVFRRFGGSVWEVLGRFGKCLGGFGEVWEVFGRFGEGLGKFWGGFGGVLAKRLVGFWKETKT